MIQDRWYDVWQARARSSSNRCAWNVTLSLRGIHSSSATPELAPGLKYSFPAPSFHRVFWHPDFSREAYPTVDDFLIAIRDYLREHVLKPLLELGCDYIQLDAPNYGQFYVDPDVRAAMEADGHDLRAELIADAEIDKVLFDGISDVTRALHICRGNGPGGIWSASGGYEPIAGDALSRFSNLDTHDNGVVLGLLTTKHGELEEVSKVKERIRAATEYVPLQRMALSPQCGFNSASQGNRLTPEEQTAKLRRVVEWHTRSGVAWARKPEDTRGLSCPRGSPCFRVQGPGGQFPRRRTAARRRPETSRPRMGLFRGLPFREPR